MKAKVVIAALLISVSAPSAFANSGINSTNGLLDSIVQGHAKPGDTVRSTSDPNVTFRVLENGKVERTNERFGTVSIANPKAEWNRTSRGR